MTLKEFVRKAIAVPFKEKGRDMEGWDCFGLLYAAYREIKAIELPQYLDYSSTKSYQELKTLIDSARPMWEKVEQSQPMDVAVFNISGMPTHVGLVIDKRNMLHTEHKIGTFLEPIFGAMWGKRLEGVYRYNGRK